MFFLTACSTTNNGNNGFYVPNYSKQFRAKVHKELTTNNVPNTIEMLKDYKVLRDQVRVDG